MQTRPFSTSETAGRPDLFTLPHKGLRRELLLVLTNAGTADWSDARSIGEFARNWAELRRLLSLHSRQEDQHFGPLLRAEGASLAARMAAAHTDVEEQHLSLLDLLIETAMTPRNDEYGLWIYRELSAFIAAYFLQMLQEEMIVMPAIWKQCTDEQIVRAQSSARAGLTLADSLQLRHMMLPAVTEQERTTFVAPDLARCGLG